MNKVKPKEVRTSSASKDFNEKMWLNTMINVLP